MKKISALLLLTLLVIQLPPIFAQEKPVIRGRVIEKSTNEPLPGVNIVELDPQNRIISGTITDINGNYVYKANSRDNKIKISFIGYVSQTFTIGDKNNISVELVAESTELDEITVVGSSSMSSLTGVSERNTTGATSKVSIEKLSGRTSVSVDDALKGQVSGLDIVAASGSPGSGSSINIRGMGSLGNANPLIVVDGIPQDLNTGDFNFAAADERDLGQLLNVAPQDIKSVEVLKDAASTAVWGSKGANGVLLIETKTGTKGKIRYTYQYRFGLNVPRPPLPMLNGSEYITMQMEQWHNAEGIYDIPDEIANNRNYVDFYNYSANTDWIGAITQTAPTHDHYLKMSGGGEKSQYYTSINYQNEDGTTINESFRRFSYRANFNYTISDNLRFTTNFSYNNSNKEENPKIRGTNVRTMAYRKAPNMSIWEYDENGNLTGEYFNPIESYQGDGISYFNPVAISNLSKNDTKKDEIQNSFKINYYITDWLQFKETFNFAYLQRKSNSFIPSSAIGADWLNGDNNSSSEFNERTSRLLSQSQFFITPFINNPNHDMTTMIMWEVSAENNTNITLSGKNGPSIFLLDPAMDSPVGNLSSGGRESRILRGVANINYVYKDKYIIGASFSADGSSNYGPEQRWSYFPSASINWRFAKEDFFPDWYWLGEESKLRASWGIAGNTVGNAYARYSYYETGSPYLGQISIIPTQMELSNLRPEIITSVNAGAELYLFTDRIFINFDAYRNLTSDLEQEKYGIPSTTGYERLDFYNGGEIENKGWELMTRGTIIQRKNLYWDINFNISQNINTFLSFPDNFNVDRLIMENGQFPQRAEVGRPIGSFYGLQYLGVYPTSEDAIAVDENGDVLRDANGNPIYMSFREIYTFQAGDAKYADINHDGKIDVSDAVYIGDSSPEFLGGFGSSVEYGDLTVSMHFFYRLGFDIINKTAMDTEGMLDFNNQSTAVLHRWRRVGQDEPGMLPRAYLNHPANNLGSNRYVEAGDFLRWQSIDISYRLSEKFTNFMNITSAEIGFNIRNVFTLTKYSGQDPEISRKEINPFLMGLDEARTPPPKVYTVRFNLNF